MFISSTSSNDIDNPPMTKQQLQAEFEKKFPTKCRMCYKPGVNPYGECKCSYEINEINKEIIEKPSDILAFFLARIPDIVKELVGEEVEIPKGDKFSSDEYPLVCSYFEGKNYLRQEIIHRLNEWGK